MSAEGSAADVLRQHVVVLGTRGSTLALIQAGLAAEALRAAAGMAVKIEIIRTEGDESIFSRDRRAGRKGLFTSELERALMERRVDLAVHSAKDLPSELRPGSAIAAVLPRGPVEDLLITKSPMRLESLPPSATIATSSVRRRRQARWRRSDVRFVDLRGNVPTRLRKFVASDWDAIILARAGLERLSFSAPSFEFEGQEFFAELLSPQQFVPSGGQGIIALQTRAESTAIASAVDHAPTHFCLRAEREFLRLLQGDCDLPVGALALSVNGQIKLSAQLFTEQAEPKMAFASGTDPARVAAEVFSQIDAG
ncbi:MAG: hydroxymethylbilane synthase [Verrucomicrobia bacterium]|nr:MAG: hydroxymethylbilane synthase [Verrucomicrobiota bacterium]